MNDVVKPNISIAQEHYSPGLVEELKPLIKKNWEESPLYEKEIALAPDFQKYRAMDDAGLVLCMTGRVDGRLVGYAIWYIIKSFNYPGESGHGIALYIEDAYRGYGVWLLKRSEALLRERGIRRFYWFARPNSLPYKLVKAMGYREDEVVMEKIDVSGH